MTKFEVGTKVYWAYFDGVRCGTVIACKSTGLSGHTYVIETLDAFYVTDRTTKLWINANQAKNEIATRKQQEAARLLASAAQLFGEIGVDVTGDKDGD